MSDTETKHTKATTGAEVTDTTAHNGSIRTLKGTEQEIDVHLRTRQVFFYSV